MADNLSPSYVSSTGQREGGLWVNYPGNTIFFKDQHPAHFVLICKPYIVLTLKNQDVKYVRVGKGAGPTGPETDPGRRLPPVVLENPTLGFF